MGRMSGMPEQTTNYELVDGNRTESRHRRCGCVVSEWPRASFRRRRRKREKRKEKRPEEKRITRWVLFSLYQRHLVPGTQTPAYTAFIFFLSLFHYHPIAAPETSFHSIRTPRATGPARSKLPGSPRWPPSRRSPVPRTGGPDESRGRADGTSATCARFPNMCCSLFWVPCEEPQPDPFTL